MHLLWVIIIGFLAGAIANFLSAGRGATPRGGLPSRISNSPQSADAKPTKSLSTTRLLRVRLRPNGELPSDHYVN